MIMRFPALLIFILLIPAFIALGHDIYLFVQQHVPNTAMLSLDLIKEKFKFSAFGFIWTHYDPNSYKEAARSLDPDTWASLDKFLTIKAFYAGLTFAGVIVVIMSVFALFGLGPMASEGGRVYSGKDKKAPSRVGKKAGGKMEYKRK